MGRGDRKKIRWAKDRERRSKERKKRLAAGRTTEKKGS
jgi:hypothetical protein